MSENIIDIAVAHSVNARVWKNKKISWPSFVSKIEAPQKTLETLKEYKQASKEEQSKIKDVGGFFGGFLRNGRRHPQNVIYRQLLTLDIDYGYTYFWDDFVTQFGTEAILHATHSHTEESPRYRLLIPLDREAAADEYTAVARKVAGILGIEYFDNTTFDINRIMFWPSVSKDVDYYYKRQEGPWLNVDETLDLYSDWKDTSQWPTNSKSKSDISGLAKKQEDPLGKRGLVGAFCRSYTIQEVIEKYLSDSYVASLNIEDRYTYKNGSTSNGLIVYEDVYTYSHHSTDPTSGQLCNAFDLVRIHKFGSLDESSKSTTSSPSFKAMEALIQKDTKVKKEIARELLKSAKIDFANAPEVFDIEKESEWMAELSADSKGNYLSSAGNLNIIVQNDPNIKNSLAYNVFDAKQYLTKSVPWRTLKDPEPLRNVDYSGFRNYIECVYGINATLKLDDSMNLELEKRSFNPVEDYLKALKWDGVPRVDSLLIDYFGCPDDLYHREAARVTLVGAVSRILVPGCKFDLVLTIVGKQGEFKSTFIKKLGKKWYSDTFITVHGKEALEQIQGVWLIEIAELSGFRKADMEAVKHFISKQEDIFRPAYGRTIETYKRMCIFIATTNEKDFLRDTTGNRRFLPASTSPLAATKSVTEDLSEEEVDQLWAEAVHMRATGAKTYLSAAANLCATKVQEAHFEVDERQGVVENYLNTLLPDDWAAQDIHSRRSLIHDSLSGKGSNEREFVCIAELWCECLQKEKEDMSRYNTRGLNDIMRNLKDWEYVNSTKNFALYGKQKYYARKKIL